MVIILQGPNCNADLVRAFTSNPNEKYPMFFIVLLFKKERDLVSIKYSDGKLKTQVGKMKM